MLHIFQLCDCTIVTQYNGEGFAELYGDDSSVDEDANVHLTLVADNRGNVARTDGNETPSDFESPVTEFDVVIYRDDINIHLPYAPSSEWLNALAENTFDFLDEHYDIDPYDGAENTEFDVAWNEGSPHPLYSTPELLEMIGGTQAHLTPAEASNFGIQTDEDVPTIILERDDDAFYYFPGYGDGVIVADDPDSFRQNITIAAMEHMAANSEADRLHNPYAGLIEDEALIPWLYRNGDIALEFWNAVASELFKGGEAVARAIDNAGVEITDWAEVRITLELRATLDHEYFAHPQINRDDQLDFVADLDGVSSPDEHPWAMDEDGVRPKHDYYAMKPSFTQFSDDAFGYDEGVYDEGSLIDIHAPDIHGLITYRIGEYSPITEDDTGFDGGLPTPKAHEIEPVAIRPCDHDVNSSPAMLEDYFADLDNALLEQWMIEECSTVSDWVLDNAIARRDA